MYEYKAQIIDKDTDEVIASVSSFSQAGLEEEMGKSKWGGVLATYDEKKRKEAEVAGLTKLFWEKHAKHSEDFEGLENYLEDNLK